MNKTFLSKKLYVVLLASIAVLSMLVSCFFAVRAKAYAADDRGLPFYVDGGGNFKFQASKEPFAGDVEEISFEYKITNGEIIRFMIGSWDAYYGYFILDKNGGGNRYSGISTTKLADGYVCVVLTLAEVTDFELAKPADDDELSMLYLNSNYASGYIDNFRYKLKQSAMVIDGAGIKLSEPYGIMFKSFIPLSSYDKTSTYGMMVVASDVLSYNAVTDNYYQRLNSLPGSGMMNYTLSPKLLTPLDKDYQTYGEGYISYVRFNGISESDINRKYTAIGYSRKDSAYKYFNMREDGRSVAEIAKIAYEEHFNEYTTENIAFLKGVLKTAGFSFNGERLEPYITRSARVRVNAVGNGVQVVKNAAYTAEPVEKIEFYGAKGERETAQLILYMTESMKGVPYTIRFSDLKNGASVIDGYEIETYVQLYQNVNTNWSKASEQPGSWYPNGTMEMLTTGWYPDALLPYETAVCCNENLLDSTNGANQGLFFITNIPADAVAGKYEGSVLITIGADEVICLPVEINVYDFTMPENVSKSIIRIVSEDIKSLYADKNQHTNGEIYNELFDFIAERGVASDLPSSDLGNRKLLESNIATMASFAVDERIGAYLLPYTEERCSLTVSYKTMKWGIFPQTETLSLSGIFIRMEDKVVDGKEYIGMKTVLTAMVEASSNECNLFKKAIIYNPQADEPGTAEGYIQNIILTQTVNSLKQYILDNCDFTGKSQVKSSVEDLQYMVVGRPCSEMVNGYDSLKITSVDETCGYCDITKDISLGVVDCFCPLYCDFYNNDYKPTMDRLLADSSKCVWWYNCVQPCAPYASFHTNAPMIRTRVNRWQQFALGVEGDFYYKCNRTRFVSDESVYYARSETEILGGLSYEGAFGDGVLVYSVYNTYGKYSSVRKQAQVNVLSSIRLENYAEGNDDYNYLAYAKRLIDGISDQSTKTAYQDRLNAIISPLFTSTATNTTNYNLLFNARNSLAALIVELA